MLYVEGKEGIHAVQAKVDRAYCFTRSQAFTTMQTQPQVFFSALPLAFSATWTAISLFLSFSLKRFTVISYSGPHFQKSSASRHVEP